MKIDPHHGSEDVPLVTLVSRNLRTMRIFVGVPWRWGIKWQWGNRKRRFSVVSDATSL